MQRARAQDVMVGTPVALSCSLLMHEASTARDYRCLALRLLTHHRGMSRLMEVLADECQQRCETLQQHDALARLPLPRTLPVSDRATPQFFVTENVMAYRLLWACQQRARHALQHCRVALNVMLADTRPLLVSLVEQKEAEYRILQESHF
ncbi:hypothetical protein B4O83_11575 [Chromohalobacter israelensis]|nr:hypothetical protein B4O83_11575 [Chromohalobacter salexigens]